MFLVKLKEDYTFKYDYKNDYDFKYEIKQYL